jgi:RNA polymerase sigma-70 factor (ECF subfamily)
MTAQPHPGPDLDLQGLAERRDDPRARAQFVRTVHQIVRRYCRALIGRSGRGYTRADDLADEVARTILREHCEEIGGPVPVEAIIYADMAPAVALAVGERPSPAHVRSRGPVSPELVHARLSTLPPRSREVLVLRAFVGLSNDQVARALGIGPEVVQEEQRVAMSRLRSL